MRQVLILMAMTASLWGQGVDTRSKLSVRGEAQLFAPADEMQVSLGTVTQEKTAGSAINANKETIKKVIQALKSLGLDEKEWSTGRISIEPVYSRQETGSYTPEIIAYRVTNLVNIRTEKLDKAGQIIDVATKNGANQIENLLFGTKDARVLRSEAITKASKNAVADARTLADATGQKLVRMLEVVLDEDSYSPARQRNFPVMMAKMGDSTPINPGEVTISASVTLVYEMAP